MRIVLLLLVFFIPVNAHAYIGPGLASGTIGVVLGILMSILLGLFAILWYPFKRLLKKFGKMKPATQEVEEDLES